MLDYKPLSDDFGGISILYGEICFMVQSLGLHVGCKNTSETLQFYDCEERLIKQKNPWGAIQYESNNTKVNFRFYRANIPITLKEELELLPINYRQDTNSTKCDPKALSIAYKFSSLEKGIHKFLLDIARILQREMKKQQISRTL